MAEPRPIPGNEWYWDRCGHALETNWIDCPVCTQEYHDQARFDDTIARWEKEER